MEWFTVKYRQPNGAITEAEFEAADKSALFKLLAEKKISAINIQPGRISKRSSGSRSVAKRTSRGSFVGLVLGILAVVAVAVAAFVAWFMFFRSASEFTTEKPIKKISRTVRTPPVKDRPQPSTSNVVEQALPVPTPPPVGNVMTARTANTGRVMTLIDGTVVTNISRSIFKGDLERGLMVAFRPGGMSGGIIRHLRMRHSDDEILEMIKEKVQIEPDDPDDVRRIKETVQSVKDAILYEIGQGTSLRSILNGLQNQNAEANKIRVCAQKLRAEAIKMKDPELVDFVVKRENEKLREAGLPQMVNPAPSMIGDSSNAKESD